MNLLLNASTKKQIDDYLLSSSHALLISGKSGAGKEAIADLISTELLKSVNLINHPYFMKITADDESIGIEKIRNIREFLGRKTTGTEKIRRIVQIINAHLMTTEAQNALLKSLEEPPEDTVFLLTVQEQSNLKSTIRSRAQELTVKPITIEQSLAFFNDDSLNINQVKTAFYLSGGYAGLMSALIANNTDHPLAQAVNDAKTLIKSSAYEKLIKIDVLSKQKESVFNLLDGLQRIVSSGLHQATQKQDRTNAKKFLQYSKQINDAQSALHSNSNIKLVLTDLFLGM